jgi:hypothetical protein
MIPLNLEVAQNPVGTFALSAVSGGTNISHAIICGDIDQQTTTPLQSVPVVPLGTGFAAQNTVPLVLSGVFFNPSATVTTVFKLRAWAPPPVGVTTNSGSWSYTVPGTGLYNPKMYLQRIG